MEASQSEPSARMPEFEKTTTGDASINILHTYASHPGAFDLALGGGLPTQSENNRPVGLDCLYLVGADFEMNFPKTADKPFIIYQGHHGDYGARQADIILPSTSYVEKDGIYVNTEGRVQQSQTAILPDASESEARDD